QMGIDQDREHAERAVVFNESHATHVGSEVIDNGGVSQRLFAGGLILQIELEIFNLGENLVPFIEWFDINRAQILAALFQQVRDQMAANETSAAANHNLFCLHNFTS